MNGTKNRRLNGLLASLLCFAMSFQCGCTVASALKGKPGIDIGGVRVGMARADAEHLLGAPIREFTSSGSVCRVYDYYAGDPPSVSASLACVFLDVITVGIWELMALIANTPINPKRERVAVAYDIDEKVVKTFDRFGDFDVLPNDQSTGK